MLSLSYNLSWPGMTTAFALSVFFPSPQCKGMSDQRHIKFLLDTTVFENLSSHYMKKTHEYILLFQILRISKVALVVQNPFASAGEVRDEGSIPGGGHGNLLQYSCLENLMDRGAQWAIVHRVTKGQTGLQRPSTQILNLEMKSR